MRFFKDYRRFARSGSDLHEFNNHQDDDLIVIDSDRILVMDAGSVSQFSGESIFYDFIDVCFFLDKVDHWNLSKSQNFFFLSVILKNQSNYESFLWYIF